MNKKGFNTYRKEVTMKREKTVQSSTVQRSSVQYIAVECNKGKKPLAVYMGNRRTFKSLHSVNKCNLRNVNYFPAVGLK